MQYGMVWVCQHSNMIILYFFSVVLMILIRLKVQYSMNKDNDEKRKVCSTIFSQKGETECHDERIEQWFISHYFDSLSSSHLVQESTP